MDPQNPPTSPKPSVSPALSPTPSPIPQPSPLNNPKPPISTFPANPTTPVRQPTKMEPERRNPSEARPDKRRGIKFPKVKYNETQDLLVKLEKSLGQKVICYYTAPEVFINQNHPDLFFDHLRTIGEQEKLALVVMSKGGHSDASLRIATIIREYCKELTIIVPSVCASAATILALSGDKIIMSPAGYLTAIDSSYIHELGPKGASGKPASVSIDQVKRVISFLKEEGSTGEDGKVETPYRTLFKYIHPALIGEMDRGSSASELIAKKMMAMHPQSFENEEQINKIAKHLVLDYPAHAFPILYEDAKGIGLPVEKATREVSDVLYDLAKNYNTVSMPATTYSSSTFYHLESFPVIIESVGKRTSFRNSFNRSLNQVLRIWQTEEDNSQWVFVKLTGNPEKPYTLAALDMPEAAVEPAQPQVAPTEPVVPIAPPVTPVVPPTVLSNPLP